MKHTDTKDFLHRALNIDLLDYVQSLGLKPTTKKDDWYFFNSPFGKKHPFEINCKSNRFIDLNESPIKGNILDFGQRYHRCNIPDFLTLLQQNYPLKNRETRHPEQVSDQNHNSHNNIENFQLDKAIEHWKAKADLKIRRIPLELAKQFLCGAFYIQHNSIKNGLAFENDSGGFNLIDGMSYSNFGTVDHTTINNGGKNIDVFFRPDDFLALQNIRDDQSKKRNNVLVLNSIYLFEKARPYMEQHEQVKLYLDHSPTCREYVGYSQWLDKDKYKDCSQFYKKEINLRTYNINEEQRKQKQQKKRGKHL